MWDPSGRVFEQEHRHSAPGQTRRELRKQAGTKRLAFAKESSAMWFPAIAPGIKTVAKRIRLIPSSARNGNDFGLSLRQNNIADSAGFGEERPYYISRPLPCLLHSRFLALHLVRVDVELMHLAVWIYHQEPNLLLRFGGQCFPSLLQTLRLILRSYG